MGCLTGYKCIFDIGTPYQKFYSIKNGQTIYVEIDNKEHALCVLAYTSTGLARSNEVLIGSGEGDRQYIIKTKLNFKLLPKLKLSILQAN